MTEATQQQKENPDRGSYFSHFRPVGEQIQQLTCRSYHPEAQHIGPDATLPEVTAVLEELVADESNVFSHDPGYYNGNDRGYGSSEIKTILRQPNILVIEENHYSPTEDKPEVSHVDLRKYFVFGTAEEIGKFDALVQAKAKVLSRGE